MVIFQNNIYAKSDMCDYQNIDFNSELSKYKIRINGFIEKNIYINNCDILYGYNKILGNEELMNKFEDNPSNFQQFSEFIKNYPKTAQFINNYKEFENFNKFSSKDIIEKVLAKINLNNKDKKSNLVFLMALSFQLPNNINENRLENDLNAINKYSEKDLEVIIPFWIVYINFYSESQNMMKYEKFYEIINEISIPTLKEYSNRQEFYIYFI